MEGIYFGILLCSIAFFVAVIYLSVMLRRVANVTITLGNSLKGVERQLEYITPELINNIKESEKTVDELSENLAATDSLFQTVDNVGESIDNLNITYQKYKEKVTDEEFKKQRDAVVEAIKWGEAANQIISKWKK
mgnify:CR=1 FL=1